MLIVTQKLKSDLPEVKLPAKLTFTAFALDDEAGDDPSAREVFLELDDTSSDLKFEGDGTSKSFKRKIAKSSTELTFTETIAGTGAGLLSFRVVLKFSDMLETGCLVRLKK